jgi:hypothetical protein
MRPLIIAGFALAVVTIVAAPAEAAKFPPGSYLQSCRNVYLDSSSGKQKLYAECPDQQGAWQHSGMQYQKCSGDIANQNGKLICAGQAPSGAQGPSNGGGAAALPAGSWQQSCRSPQLNGSMLTATCLRGGGGLNFSSLDIRACGGGPVGNRNGNLFCEGGGMANQAGGNQGGNTQNANNQGGNDQGGNNQGGTNQGGANQGGTNQGGSDQVGGDQGGNAQSGGDETGNAQGGQPANAQGGQSANTQGGQPANTGGATTANAGAGMPAGNWQRTCRTPHLSESVLTANCQRRDGAYHYSALDLQSCDGGPVGNDNGRLVCETGGQSGGQTGGQTGGQAGGDQGGGNAANGNGGAGGALPAGSWQQSCHNPQVNGSMLTASCQRQDGGFRFSAIDVRSCPGGRVGNFEGSLACE